MYQDQNQDSEISRPKSRPTQSRGRENCEPDSAFLVLDLRVTYVRGLELADAALPRYDELSVLYVARWHAS